MRWIAIFTNKPNTDTLREAHLQAHLAYFAAQSNITMAGSTTPVGEQISNGGVWIVKGLTYQETMDLIEQDPFFIAGLREKIEVFDYQVAPQFEEVV